MIKVKKEISRQRKWQLKKIKQNKCQICGKSDSSNIKGYCLEHSIKKREQQRILVNSVKRSLNCKSYREQRKKLKEHDFICPKCYTTHTRGIWSIAHRKEYQTFTCTCGEVVDLDIY
tara:strand:+ start:1088 stop:1438 length:351 start_codon:yes stop_codon:yes gene_type:complete